MKLRLAALALVALGTWQVASAAWMEPPVGWPTGSPVIAAPGLTPMSPTTVVVAPVLVTVEPPSTTNVLAAPSGDAAGPAPGPAPGTTHALVGE